MGIESQSYKIQKSWRSFYSVEKKKICIYISCEYMNVFNTIQLHT